MNTNRNLFALTFLILCAFSFLASKKSGKLDDLIAMLKRQKPLESYKIHFDGAYTLYDTTKGNCDQSWYDRYFLHNFCYFYENGFCDISDINLPDSSSSNLFFLERKDKFETAGQGGGVYEVVGDTIKMIIQYPFALRGMHFKTFITHFRGILKSPDTITDFKMIKPYPAVNLKFNDNFDYELKPKTMIFRRLPAKTYIDSNKVWINRYR